MTTTPKSLTTILDEMSYELNCYNWDAISPSQTKSLIDVIRKMEEGLQSAAGYGNSAETLAECAEILQSETSDSVLGEK